MTEFDDTASEKPPSYYSQDHGNIRNNENVIVNDGFQLQRTRVVEPFGIDETPRNIYEVPRNEIPRNVDYLRVLAIVIFLAACSFFIFCVYEATQAMNIFGESCYFHGKVWISLNTVHTIILIFVLAITSLDWNDHKLELETLLSTFGKFSYVMIFFGFIEFIIVFPLTGTLYTKSNYVCFHTNVTFKLWMILGILHFIIAAVVLGSTIIYAIMSLSYNLIKNLNPLNRTT